MQVVRDALRSVDVPYGAVVTLGNYDGLHRGQRKVIDAAIARARQLGVPSALITFVPHPLQVLRPSEAPPMLMVAEQRERLLAEIGIDALLLLKFNRELATQKPAEFVKRFLVDTLGIAEIFVGENFAFGHERRGNLALLEEMGRQHGFVAHGVAEATWIDPHDDATYAATPVISSSRIRRAVREGKVEAAMEMLGRPYSLLGTVVRGDRMGQKLGWPTINLAPKNEHLPADGVYAGRVSFPAMAATFDCVTNVGTRPTIYENYQRVVESHILDFGNNVYGQEVEVFFWKRLREERLFPSVMDLAAQIRLDAEAAREYFASRRRLPLQSTRS